MLVVVVVVAVESNMHFFGPERDPSGPTRSVKADEYARDDTSGSYAGFRCGSCHEK